MLQNTTDELVVVHRSTLHHLQRHISDAAGCLIAAPVRAQRHLSAAALLLGEATPVATPSADGGERPMAVWQKRRVATYIEETLHTLCRTSYLARRLDLSTSHFSRLFRATFSLTPQQYILRRRIARALKAMADEEAGIADIALQCGFCDQSHFCRSFKRIVGMSPTRWRRERSSGTQLSWENPQPLLDLDRAGA